MAATSGRLLHVATRRASLPSAVGLSSSTTSMAKAAQSGSVKDLAQMVENEKRGIFRRLDIGLPKESYYSSRIAKRSDRVVVKAAPREKLMKPDQDWNSVWPAQRTFHPAVVPLPVRQGFVQLKDQVKPSKYANVELMKIPNFLHLTPPTIKMQCKKLKEFCTEWPKVLGSDEEIDAHLPLEEITSDYLNASSSIRDSRSRIVTVNFKLSSLNLTARAKDKFLRLVGESRYDFATDKVTITSDRCPYRQQNRDYCNYLIKVLYVESNKVEDWEVKEESDLDLFQLEDGTAGGVDEKRLDYQESLKDLLNCGENIRSIENYKKSVRNLLGLEDTLPLIPERA